MQLCKAISIFNLIIEKFMFQNNILQYLLCACQFYSYTTADYSLGGKNLKVRLAHSDHLSMHIGNISGHVY